MSFSRRKALGIIASALPAAAMQKAPSMAMPPGIEPQSGPFIGTRESLREWEIPEWFRDAKFGIWAHWGPQSAIEAGDWYARNMYMEGSREYEYHCEHYGHPSKFGFKDTDSPLEGRELGSRQTDADVQRGWCEILFQHGRSSR